VLARRDTYFAYLAAFTFVTSIALGSLIFLMISYAVGARWSIVLRRLNESIVSVLPLLALLFVPIAFGLRDLYLWIGAVAVALEARSSSSCITASAISMLRFFWRGRRCTLCLWSACGRLLERWSLRKDALSPGAGRTLLALVAEPAPSGCCHERALLLRGIATARRAGAHVCRVRLADVRSSRSGPLPCLACTFFRGRVPGELRAAGHARPFRAAGRGRALPFAHHTFMRSAA
jgi:hypothetical protein